MFIHNPPQPPHSHHSFSLLDPSSSNSFTSHSFVTQCLPPWNHSNLCHNLLTAAPYCHQAAEPRLLIINLCPLPCALSPHREFLSYGLFTLILLLLFLLLLTTAERFFCPSLQLISEYLRLSPAVAGATLLAFGNGAPDLFTQLAAIQTVGDPLTRDAGGS